ncbi:PE-PPE like protein [Mycobacterium phage Myrna]|uniref:PE-PPE like protein n=1 Tax=Mycobacterium phage Myrna TaxID=546805 RepID=B5LJ44_9CAUD|nr:DNA binding protein [Mycobacterium phage Myrna]ACH62041.1 PE-PPE like protein [Mycobacterium phage Myrna]
MNRIIPTALAAAALATSVPIGIGVAEAARTVYIAGTREITADREVTVSEYEKITGSRYDSPQDQDFIVQYNRELAPFIGTTFLDRSVAGGVKATPVLQDGDRQVCVSQGCLVAAGAANQNPVALAAHFDQYGDPTNRDGGLVTKLPFIPTVPRTPAAPLPENSTRTTWSIEREIIADAPDVPVWQNPLAWAESVASGIENHSKYSQAYLDEQVAAGKVVEVADDDNNPNDKHYLVKRDQLSITRPVRDLEYGLTRQNRGTDALDDALRPIINKGWKGDRTGTLVTSGPKPQKDEEAKDDNDTTSAQRRNGASEGASGVSRDQKDDRPSDSDSGSGAGQD